MHILHSTCWKKTIILRSTRTFLQAVIQADVKNRHSIYIVRSACMPQWIDFVQLLSLFHFLFLFGYWERTTIIIAIFLWCFKVGSDHVSTDWLTLINWPTHIPLTFSFHKLSYLHSSYFAAPPPSHSPYFLLYPLSYKSSDIIINKIFFNIDCNLSSLYGSNHSYIWIIVFV